jgi:hypothetical protein
MSKSVADILGSRKYDEPPELIVIRDFVRSMFDEVPKLKVTTNTIIITVSSAALAGALRPHLHKLQDKINSLSNEKQKRLLIRIG